MRDYQHMHYILDWGSSLVGVGDPRSLVPHACGPFVFISYMCKNHVVALIRMGVCEEDVSKAPISNSLLCPRGTWLPE